MVSYRFDGFLYWLPISISFLVNQWRREIELLEDLDFNFHGKLMALLKDFKFEFGLLLIPRQLSLRILAQKNFTTVFCPFANYHSSCTQNIINVQFVAIFISALPFPVIDCFLSPTFEWRTGTTLWRAEIKNSTRLWGSHVQSIIRRIYR